MIYECGTDRERVYRGHEAIARLVNCGGVVREGRVFCVNDADGLIMGSGEENFTVRLAGIDGAECVARGGVSNVRQVEERRCLNGVCGGSSVIVISDPLQVEFDRYGRLIGYVFRAVDLFDVNLWMIMNTTALPWRRGKYSRRIEFIAESAKRFGREKQAGAGTTTELQGD
jgi:endonuclease YncB( thermonuclease family)